MVVPLILYGIADSATATVTFSGSPLTYTIGDATVSTTNGTTISGGSFTYTNPSTYNYTYYNSLEPELSEYFDCLTEDELSEYLDKIIARKVDPSQIIIKLVSILHFSEDFLSKYISYLTKEILFINHKREIISGEYATLKLLLEAK